MTPQGSLFLSLLNSKLSSAGGCWCHSPVGPVPCCPSYLLPVPSGSKSSFQRIPHRSHGGEGHSMIQVSQKKGKVFQAVLVAPGRNHCVCSVPPPWFFTQHPQIWVVYEGMRVFLPIQHLSSGINGSVEKLSSGLRWKLGGHLPV